MQATGQPGSRLRSVATALMEMFRLQPHSTFLVSLAFPGVIAESGLSSGRCRLGIESLSFVVARCRRLSSRLCFF